MIKKVCEFPDISYAEKKFVADYAERARAAAEERAEAEKTSAVRTLGFSDDGAGVPVAEVKKVYFAGGGIYVYCGDGKVYGAVKNNSGAYAFAAAGSRVYSAAPQVIAVRRNGKKKVLLLGADGAEISGESGQASVPYGKVCATAGGRLFIANGREIRFSEAFDCLEFSTGISGAAGVIEVGGDEGGVVCMGGTGDELVILCRRKALALTAAGEVSDWNLKRVATDGFSVEENTAAWCGGSAVFRSGKRLYAYRKSVLKAVKSATNDKEIALLGSACAFGSVYLLPAEENGKRFVYAYDTATGEEFFLPYLPLLSDKGGVAYDSENKRFMRVGFGTAEVAAGDAAGLEFSPSGTEDFGTPGNKLLLRAVIRAAGAGKVKISGASDAKIFLLAAGLNLVQAGITSREFKIEYSGFSAGKGVLSAEFTYCLRGY